VVPEMTDWTKVPVAVWHGMAHWPDNPLARAILRPLGRHHPGHAAHVAAAS
jgi:hypothetical protein